MTVFILNRCSLICRNCLYPIWLTCIKMWSMASSWPVQPTGHRISLMKVDYREVSYGMLMEVLKDREKYLVHSMSSSFYWPAIFNSTFEVDLFHDRSCELLALLSQHHIFHLWHDEFYLFFLFTASSTQWKVVCFVSINPKGCRPVLAIITCLTVDFSNQALSWSLLTCFRMHTALAIFILERCSLSPNLHFCAQH